MTKLNLSTAIDIDATPQQVWNLLSDLRRMPEWSPQCRWMRPLGALRTGGLTVNMNRRGRKYWPTVSRIERVETGRALAFRTLSNSSVWTFEISPIPGGARVVERRDVPPQGTKWISKVIVEHALGGEDPFDAEMLDGMNATLTRVKAAAETSIGAVHR